VITIDPLLLLIIVVGALCLIGYLCGSFVPNEIITKSQGEANRSSMMSSDKLLWLVAIVMVIIVIVKMSNGHPVSF
jgi:Na+-transporting methylmalonyl-CoA/oxaloacetate decarboxylase gamma subunit